MHGMKCHHTYEIKLFKLWFDSNDFYVIIMTFYLIMSELWLFKICVDFYVKFYYLSLSVKMLTFKLFLVSKCFNFQCWHFMSISRLYLIILTFYRRTVHFYLPMHYCVSSIQQSESSFAYSTFPMKSFLFETAWGWVNDDRIVLSLNQWWICSEC